MSSRPTSPRHQRLLDVIAEQDRTIATLHLQLALVQESLQDLRVGRAVPRTPPVRRPRSGRGTPVLQSPPPVASMSPQVPPQMVTPQEPLPVVTLLLPQPTV